MVFAGDIGLQLYDTFFNHNRS